MFQPKLICFDLDLTLIAENSWRELNSAMGVLPEEDDQLVRWGTQGIIDDQMGQHILANIYVKRGQANRANMVAQAAKFTLVEGAKEAIDKLQAAGYEVVIISGALDLVVASAAEALGIKTWYSGNVLVFENDELTGIATDQNNYQFKLKTLIALCNERGIETTDCVFVGDGNSDVPVFEATGHGICKRGDSTESKAWKVVDSLVGIPGLFVESAN